MTAAVMVALGGVVAVLSLRRDDGSGVPGFLGGTMTAIGGVLVWVIGHLRFHQAGPEGTVLDARAASVLLAALVVVVAIVIGVSARLA